ncbi:hypothetical protein BN109_009 [Yersinia phage phi80-18]|uniref:Uncharacterized protein n=1 Tax=Yersinia phage phi80-18 TaxID=1206559 RepID=I7J419_9CAUD|nr:hypothetical protein BN109_009 [Yersinia phage phi80-18]CCI88848.2 hypothetical protein BN109_009 [Yersinia phage phi80-18]
MALVHSQTPNAKPEDQKKGTYQITPFEVQAWLRGESLNTKDYALVHAFYAALGQTPPDQNKEPFYSNKGGGVQTEPALTGQTGDVVESSKEELTGWGSAVSGATQYVGTAPKRLVKPASVFTGPLESLRQIAKLSVATLPDNDAWEVLVSLAKRFNLEIE